jgi:two-component system nitrogen regulation sensor histidine kinase NtrY
MLGGLMRSAGDLLLTSMFFVAALYGVLKISRGESATLRDGPPPAAGRSFVLKGLFAAAVSIGVFVLAKGFISNVVTNANPRLVGETVKVLEPEVAVLHLSAFLMVAGIFLAGMICVWGVYRLGGRAGTSRASAVAVAAVVVVSLVLLRVDVGLISLLALLFAIFAPRLVQREDLVSIVTGAFCFVIIVSAAAYVFFDQEYQELRRTFIQEKAVEVTHPSDNWKVFILEDILENFSQEPSIRQSLADPVSSNVQRLAFDLWAGSPLSLLGYSCAIHVFDDADSMVSRFAVEMPYRLRPDEADERLETPSSQEWAVLDLTTDTPQGTVRFYRGILNLEEYLLSDRGVSTRLFVGKVVVDIPFFFENLAWAARTGPQTPEVLRNVQEGGIAPRLEETEPILLARTRGTRVLDSSAEVLPVGYTFDPQALEKAAGLEWPLLRTSGATYRFLSQKTDDPGMALVAGFAIPTLAQHVLRWSTILSLYFFFTVGLIASIIVLKGLPVLKPVLPTLTPGREFGFQQKLLGSFLLVALLPAVILGIFSVRMIRERFVQETRNEALYRAFSADKSLNNLLVEDLYTLLDDYDIEALVGGRVPPRWRYDDKRRVRVLVESSPALDGGGGIDERSAARGDRGGGRTDEDERWLSAYGGVSGLVDRVSPGQIFMHYVGGKPYFGVVSDPFPFLSHGKKETYVVYHARLVDAELLGEVSDQVGADVNIFDGGELVATSREGLLSGGFISSTMNADAFVRVSMMGVDHSLSTEKAGRYRYQVAYVPIPSLGLSGHAAIGVPLLFRPESYSVEVEKARSVVLSIFALLSAATIGLGLLLARGIFEPLRGLLEGTKRIGRGDFSFKLPGKRRDEIGTVVEAFNEMTHQVSRSQSALEERRKYLEVILVNIGTGVISTDAVNRISAVNNAAERILGRRSEELLGKTAGELAGAGILPDFFSRLASDSQSADDASWARDARSAVGSESASSGPASDESREPPAASSEVDIVKDGQKRTIKYVRTRLSTDGRHLGTVFVFEDLTELISSKKLSAWVEMARQIAHEIKNPLTPIKLSTQFMVRAHEEKSGDFDKIFRESSDTIMQQVDVLRNIASEFSSFGRLQQLYLSPHRVIPLVEDIVSPYQRNTTGVTVTLDTPNRDLRAVIDPEAVRKICTNLIENAMEAMSGGGELRISCDEATYDHRRMVRVSFRDTGPGLSDEVKGRLFEPYFSTKTTGTGLGLAICRSLSREMGGDVTVGNVPDNRGVQAALYLKPA